MVRPLGLQTFDVHFGPAQALVSGDSLRMVVRFTPSTSAIWGPTRTPLIAFMETVEAQSGMQGVATLPVPDQDGFTDGLGHTVRGWTYRADMAFYRGNDVVGKSHKDFTFTAGMTSPLDLEAAIPLPSTSGVKLTVPVVSSAFLDDDELVLVDLFGGEILRADVRGPRGYIGQHGNSVDVGNGPPTAPGSYVNSYIDASTGDLYRWSASGATWGSPVGNLRGPAGPAAPVYDGGTRY